MGKILDRFISYYRANYFDPDKQNIYQVFTYKIKPDDEKTSTKQLMTLPFP